VSAHPLAWAFVAGAASSLLFVGLLLILIVLLRDRSAPTHQKLPPSFQPRDPKPKIVVPSERDMRRRRDALAAWSKR